MRSAQQLGPQNRTLRFRVQGLGFRVLGLGFRVNTLSILNFQVETLGLSHGLLPLFLGIRSMGPEYV